MDRACSATADDIRLMQAALAYGRRGLGTTAPNPCVAALVVKDGAVIGRGVTAPGGRPHAETQALEQAGPAARGATLVVTLEPCSHLGRTKPCADAVIEAGIARAVVATGDPDPRVAGRGIARMRAAGIAVALGVCEAEARRDHIGHIRRVTSHRPMVTLKLAETADGFSAAPGGKPRLMITGPDANAWVHVARAAHDAVLVGIGTAQADDPMLTVRLPGMAAHRPIRIVVDSHARLLPASRLAATAGTHHLIVITGPQADPVRARHLRALGADVIAAPAESQDRVDLGAALGLLASRGLTRVFCEGGPRLGAALLRADLLDDVVLLSGQDRLAQEGLPAFDATDRAALETPDRFRLAEERWLGPDRLRRYERMQ